MAPEVVQRTPNGYDETVDWWSLGIITFELMTGCSPFTVDGHSNSSKDIARLFDFFKTTGLMTELLHDEYLND